MRTTKQETIGGKTYTLLQCGAVEGSKAGFRLAKIIGPAWAKATSAGPEEGLKELLSLCSEADFEYFRALMAEYTHVDGVKLSTIFDEHFVGKYTDMTKWLTAAMKHNFESFLPEGLLTKLQEELRVSAQATPLE